MGAPTTTAATPGHTTHARLPGTTLYHPQYHHHDHHHHQQQQRQRNTNNATMTTGGEPATDENTRQEDTAAAGVIANDSNGLNSSNNLEATYTSLIQEYLQVMCIDNATFLAERMVATFPNSSNARYLLGVCHYRAREPRRALAVLETATTSLSSSRGLSTQPVPPATSYIMAKCCFDLNEYNRAEQIMLDQARRQYKVYKSSFAAAAEQQHQQQQNGDNNTTTVLMTMDEWLVETSPCPVPNGAAGLYLLGNICRRSTRKQRAMDYFRMSLQLDPLMWVSYEALCEMGAVDIDPTKVFGVRPKEIDMLQENLKRQNAQEKSKDGMPLRGKSVLTPHQFTPPGGNLARGATMYTATGTKLPDGRKVDLSTPTSSSSFLPKTSLFQTTSKPPVTSTHPNTGEPIRPNQLHFDTPNLTPIPMQQDASFIHQHHHQQQPVDSHDGLDVIDSCSIDFADSFNPHTVRRAKHVAARLYYQPSPETPNVRGIDDSISSPAGAPSSARRYLRGRSAMLFSNNTLDRNISETPLRRGGRPSDISTTRRPRTLFLSEHKAMRENTNDLNQSTSSCGEGLALSLSGRVPSASSEDEENRHQIPSDEILIGNDETPHDENDDEQPDLDDNGDDIVLDDDDDDDDPEHQRRPWRQATDVKPTTTFRKGYNAQEHLAEIMDEDTVMEQHSCVQQILELLCLVGAGYWRLCQFRCTDALQAFRSLPQAQHNTGWVLHQEGRAYLEMADYENARRSLQLMERREPHRMKGLELLSTVLWQLKREVDLAHLAQRAVDFDRMSPEAWCVVGNCFSLQKEHETALVFFGRSLQLDPGFTYTHTLSGYEYMANEDFEKAMACFRNAILSDERHYNAWYGMGAIYHRQEKYDLAEYHFQRAVEINPQSSVLRCNLGMSQYSNGKSLEALDTLSIAFRLDPNNPQARFQRATIYIALNRPEQALEELEKVRDAAPREATVHFAMGKVLKRLGRPQEAMRCFLTALDLDPKDNQLIKSAMDKLDEPDLDEEVTAF